MKKILLLLALTTFTINAQQKFDFPLNENGQIIFTEVVSAEGKTKDDLYNNSKMFFVNIYKVTQDKLKQNKEASSVSDTQYSFMTIKANGSEVKVKLFYNIAILSKDGKYKYEIKNILIKMDSEIPLEKMFDKLASEKVATKPKLMETLKAYYAAINAEVETIKSNIKQEMAKSGAAKSDW
ncbi:DUF4468 domain-containing protein [Flavobacterium sp. GT3R68]|uniref:DUF4468 domain-containing protein n=1 Tax=Flavobacterium sp. GT3R68 TaxID=2594437 RepID=UPI000F89D05A|nr:DUF4468 domain-containing protein [Flavobacterium sp. GT3R68]RTY89096.1 DUF4468 domain-containing protein [Flavobacterium sp. GSN2]TRW90106.1 DUF4468 domain-containing protein [Flavobacterium sp. GT3R68]